MIHSQQEFLLFLLPLVRPQRLLRRLLRLPTHPWVLAFWLAVLPRMLSKRLGLYRDEKGKPRFRPSASLPFGLGFNEKNKAVQIAKYPHLPDGVCAICWEGLEDRAGIQTRGEAVPESGAPSSDPTDPAIRSLPSDSTGRSVAPRNLAAKTTSALSTMTSSSGISYADAIIHTPYSAEPCGHTYCYVCLSSKLLSEDAAEELADSSQDDSVGAWHCLRCGQGVRTIKRNIVASQS